MRVVRIYTGPDNRSHFEDLQIPLKDGDNVGFLSERMKATGVVFRETTGDYNYDFHTAPRRQLVVNLEDEVEIEKFERRLATFRFLNLRGHAQHG